MIENCVSLAQNVNVIFYDFFQKRKMDLTKTLRVFEDLFAYANGPYENVNAFSKLHPLREWTCRDFRPRS